MRLIYLDEAGISNPAQEPFLVVAGIAIHADGHFKAIESHIDDLAKKHLPEHMHGRVPFHAMELYHGTKNFDRRIWPLEKRLEILNDLAEIPTKFSLPIFWGSTDRLSVPGQLDGPASPLLVEQICHGHAFFKFVLQVEVIMRALASDEVAMLIAEDRPIMRKMLKFAHAILRGRAPPEFQGLLSETLVADPILSKLVLPLERIVETVHFAEKGESSLLQIADLCAFTIKRNMMKASHHELLYGAIEQQITFTPKIVEALVSSVRPS